MMPRLFSNMNSGPRTVSSTHLKCSGSFTMRKPSSFLYHHRLIQQVKQVKCGRLMSSAQRLLQFNETYNSTLRIRLLHPAQAVMRNHLTVRVPKLKFSFILAHTVTVRYAGVEPSAVEAVMPILRLHHIAKFLHPPFTHRSKPQVDCTTYEAHDTLSHYRWDDYYTRGSGHLSNFEPQISVSYAYLTFSFTHI